MRRIAIWLEFAAKCGYLEAELACDLYRIYHTILATILATTLATIAGMITQPETRTITSRKP